MYAVLILVTVNMYRYVSTYEFHIHVLTYIKIYCINLPVYILLRNEAVHIFVP